FLIHLPRTATATTETYTLSLHDALPIFGLRHRRRDRRQALRREHWRRHERQSRGLWGALVALFLPHSHEILQVVRDPPLNEGRRDRKSTRLNSSHLGISYAVFCLKKKKK